MSESFKQPPSFVGKKSAAQQSFTAVFFFFFFLHKNVIIS